MKRHYSRAQQDLDNRIKLMHQDNTIWSAVFKADKNAIETLIDANPGIIHERGVVGECPIHMLFLHGSDKHLEIARDLLTRFPEIVIQTYNKPMYYGENVLHMAIVKRNPTMVEWLLSNERLKSYREQLLTATATGDYFKIGQPAYYGETPLGFACCTSQWDIVEILLKYGANMDTTDSNGNTILHTLVICNLPEIYEKYKACWIEKQTNNSESEEVPNLWDRLNYDKLTPLTLAADLGRRGMLSWLLHERKKVQWSYGDFSYVLHPLDQLDLDLREGIKKHPLSILEIIIKNNASELCFPIITSLVDKKWNYFVYRIFFRRLLANLIYLFAFLTVTIMERPKIASVEENNINNRWNIVRQIIFLVGRAIVIGGALLQLQYEIKEIIRTGFRQYYLHSSGSIFLQNTLHILFSVSILTVQILRLLGSEHGELVLAIASLLGWCYLFFFIMPFQFTGPFVIMIYKMLFNDVLRFCIIFLIFLAGFSQTFFILLHEDGFEGYISSIKRCFLGLFGNFDLDFHIDGKYPLVNVGLLILYIVVITILLLNLLIAMMGDTYQDVKKDAKKLWHLERARIALDIEKGMSISERKSEVNKYWIEIHEQRYLEVEQATNYAFHAKDDDEDVD